MALSHIGKITKGFDSLRKDRSVTQNKSGGGLVLYHKES